MKFLQLHLIVCIHCVFLITESTQAQTPQKQVSVSSLFKSHCFECHDQVAAEAEIDLETFFQERADPVIHASILIKLKKVLSNKSMPPTDAENQLKPKQRQSMLQWIEQNLDRLAEQHKGDPGQVVITRLSSYEYRNVIRDLSGGVVTTGGQFLPNEGGAGEGFANVGQAQGMSIGQFENYLAAAKQVLRHLRVTPHSGFVWSTIPHDPVDSPKSARDELVAEIISWYIAQQQKWGEEHRNLLNDRLGFVHAAYLEAALRYRYRKVTERPIESFASCDGISLSPVALRKWWHILNHAKDESPFLEWAKAWRKLPDPYAISPHAISKEELRKKCLSITLGKKAGMMSDEYAPEYEIGFYQDKQKIINTAKQLSKWRFQIKIDNARILYLLVTDAGDGRQGEYAIWQRGKILFQDGTSKPWEEVVSVVGANSGRKFKWGVDGEGAENLSKDSIGVRPPGTLKFQVPNNASVFEVELVVDKNRTQQASIQALVLTEEPTTQGYFPGRYVFGGKKRNASNQQMNKALFNALRKRNVSEANRTKVGLNAERNVFKNWENTSLEDIGGPWPDQLEDQANPNAPYHYTVEQVLENATSEDLHHLRMLENRLASITQPNHQRIVELGKSNRWKSVQEGILPNDEVSCHWPTNDQSELQRLIKNIQEEEARNKVNLKQWLTQYIRRAWRNVTNQELETLIRLYANARDQGFSFDSSVKASVLSVLMSPHFLYRSFSSDGSVEKQQQSSAQVYQSVPLTNDQLASRVSFFLWASIPDDVLLRLADEQRLSNPVILRQQVRRMLKDRKAKSLAVDFAGQLWGFSDFQMFRGPDEHRFPEFNQQLTDAMYHEVTHYLDDLFRKDRPLLRLLDSEYTFANAQLANHYNLNQFVKENAFIRVSVDQTRGGLTGMGLFLTKSSPPLRTSPVQRGVWVLEQLLGDELPNPPADVEPLSEDDKNQRGENIQQQLKRHREQANCASCHDKIDPLGIALENYDPIGRWRNSERDGSPLATNSISDDKHFIKGAVGLKQYLLHRKQDVFRHFNRKLLGYALGRVIGPGDQSLLQTMEKNLTENDYRFSVLLETIVTSHQFTHARVEE